MKVLITGTHLTPALAVIDELKKYNNLSLVYVGRKNTMEGDNAFSVESQVIPEEGVKFIPVMAGRIQRVFTLYTIPALLKIPIGFLHAFLILLKEKPDVILSFGGYVSVPIVVWGWLLSIPVIVHQQTLVEGLANKITNLFADKVALSFGDMKLGGKYILTGNPLREEILKSDKNLKTEFDEFIKRAKRNKLPLILITGGNQGSHIINMAVESILDKLLKIAYVIHATGDNKLKDFENLEKQKSERYLVKKWIDKGWGKLLSETDLIITRAGINTLLEIAFFQKKAIVIPIPYLSGQEQEKNAKFFENLGIATILPQSKLSGESILRLTRELLKKQFGDWMNTEKVKKVVIIDAAKRLALETVLLSKKDS